MNVADAGTDESTSQTLKYKNSRRLLQYDWPTTQRAAGVPWHRARSRVRCKPNELWRTGKRDLRSGPQQPRDGAGASPSAKGGSVAGYLAESGGGSNHHSEGREDAEEPEDLQGLLGVEPPLPAHPTAAVNEMLAAARGNTPGLRDWPLARAKNSASGDLSRGHGGGRTTRRRTLRAATRMRAV